MNDVRAFFDRFAVGARFTVVRDQCEGQSSIGEVLLDRRTPRDCIDGFLTTDCRTDAVLKLSVH